jgi:Copper transport outer membrane protein, MctB
MIDFRYHLVSIVAVFLALAIGIILGATQLQPTTQRELDNQSKTESQQINSLHSQNRSLESQLRSSQAFATANAPAVLAGQLTGQRVVLVTAPGADGSIATGITTALTQAGAKVTGQVAVQSQFFGTTSGDESTLDSLARRLTPVGFDPPDPPAQLASDSKIAAQLTAAELMAFALGTQAVTGTAGQPAQNSSGLTTAQAGQILKGFADQGFLQVSPASGATTLEPATLAVVVIPSNPPQAGDADPANLALISVAYQLRMASRAVVVAGSLTGSGPGSAIDELINGNTGAQLSSVDDADFEQGQITVAQVLAGLLAGQKPAAYGVGTQIVATPVPAPSATPSPSKSATTTKSSG